MHAYRCPATGAQAYSLYPEPATLDCSNERLAKMQGPAAALKLQSQAGELYLRGALLLHLVEFSLQAALRMLARQKEFNFVAGCVGVSYMIADDLHTED